MNFPHNTTQTIQSPSNMALGNPPFRSMIFPARKTSRSVTFGDFPASHLADFPRLIPKITWLKIIHPYTSKTYDIPKYELLIIPRISPSAPHWYWWFQSLWKIWKSVGVIIPNIWNVINFMFQTFQTTNQKKMVTIPNPRFPLAPPKKKWTLSLFRCSAKASCKRNISVK